MGALGQLAGDRDPRRALTLLHAAVATRERTGVPQLPVPIARQLDRARDAGAARVASQVAERCRVHARAMTTEEAIAYALAGPEHSEPGPGAATHAPAAGGGAARAEGLSNRAIAERLHLSVRTVETHVDNVLSELGFHSRVQLAG